MFNSENKIQDKCSSSPSFSRKKSNLDKQDTLTPRKIIRAFRKTRFYYRQNQVKIKDDDKNKASSNC